MGMMRSLGDLAQQNMPTVFIMKRDFYHEMGAGAIARVGQS
jgi:hypothetical protein